MTAGAGEGPGARTGAAAAEAPRTGPAGGGRGELPAAVRDEDAFDVPALDAWLRAHADGSGAPAGTRRGIDRALLGDAPPEVRQFGGGASNRTYLLRYPGADLVLRRPPAGARTGTAHDVLREARIQERLAPAFPYVPRVVAAGEEPEAQGLLDGPFYVMERIDGPILRGDLPKGETLDPDAARRLSEEAIDRLVELHAVDVRAAGLTDLGRGAGYVERQVAGWSKRYRAARTGRAPRFERTMRWLEEHRPADVATCVVHNDWRLDNLVLDPGGSGRVVGVLDWEMATLGDPLMDLGSALAYWVQADDGRGMQLLRRQPTHLPGMLTREQVVQRYCARSGITPEDWTFYEVFGLFRLAVIVQQLYKRYHDGLTRNPAFRTMWIAVIVLDRRCRRIIRRAGG
jgi:aminoglycoside phosphotransferase (APT) family kinase protein